MGGDWYTPKLVYGLRVDYSTARALLCERNRREGTWKGSDDLTEEESRSFLDSDGEPYDYSEDVIDEEKDSGQFCASLLALARAIHPSLPAACAVYAVTNDHYSWWSHHKYDLCDMDVEFVFGSEIPASPLSVESLQKAERELCGALTQLQSLIPAAAPQHDHEYYPSRLRIGAYVCIMH
jgi:hypothetical protein